MDGWMDALITSIPPVAVEPIDTFVGAALFSFLGPPPMADRIPMAGPPPSPSWPIEPMEPSAGSVAGWDQQRKRID